MTECKAIWQPWFWIQNNSVTNVIKLFWSITQDTIRLLPPVLWRRDGKHHRSFSPPAFEPHCLASPAAWGVTDWHLPTAVPWSFPKSQHWSTKSLPGAPEVPSFAITQLCCSGLCSTMEGGTPYDSNSMVTTTLHVSMPCWPFPNHGKVNYIIWVFAQVSVQKL